MDLCGLFAEDMARTAFVTAEVSTRDAIPQASLRDATRYPLFGRQKWAKMMGNNMK